MMSLNNIALCVRFAAAVVPASGCSSPQDRIPADLYQIVWMADFLHSTTGAFPQTWNEMLLEGNVAHGFAQPVRDPWGNPYVYRVINGKPVAICYGEDAQRGGDGEDEDVGVVLKEPGTNRRRESSSEPWFQPGRRVAFEFEGTAVEREAHEP